MFGLSISARELTATAHSKLKKKLGHQRLTADVTKICHPRPPNLGLRDMPDAFLFQMGTKLRSFEEVMQYRNSCKRFKEVLDLQGLKHVGRLKYSDQPGAASRLADAQCAEDLRDILNCLETLSLSSCELKCISRDGLEFCPGVTSYNHKQRHFLVIHNDTWLRSTKTLKGVPKGQYFLRMCIAKRRWGRLNIPPSCYVNGIKLTTFGTYGRAYDKPRLCHGYVYGAFLFGMVEFASDQAEANIVIENAYDVEETSGPDRESHPYFLLEELQMVDCNSIFEKKATKQHPKVICIVS